MDYTAHGRSNRAGALSLDLSLKERIEILSGKMDLKVNEFSTYKQRTTDEMANNEGCITELRCDNHRQRIILAEHEHGDEQVIKRVFMNARIDRLALQGCTAPCAIDDMYQKVCERWKKLNKLWYERGKCETILKERSEEYDMLLSVAKPPTEDLETNCRLENALDKSLMKYDTACTITTKYEDILKCLKEESLYHPTQLDLMEKALQLQKSELNELQELSMYATKESDMTRVELSEKEVKLKAERYQRDVEITAARTEVDKHKVEAEKIEKRISSRQSNKHLQGDDLSREEQMEIEKRQKKIYSYEEAFEMIKEETSVRSVEELVARVKNQTEKNKKLKDDVKELERVHLRLTEEKNAAKISLDDIKTNCEHKLSRGQKALEEMQQTIETEECDCTSTEERLKQAREWLLPLQLGVETLLDKLYLIKLKPMERNYSRGTSVVEELQLCTEKIIQLMKDLGINDLDTDIKSRIELTDNYQDFLEEEMAPENNRIDVQPISANLPAWDSDDEDNEAILTSSGIKKLSRKIVDKNFEPKKKKVPTATLR